MGKNTIRLNSGAEMPVLGLGTWQSDPGKVGAAVEYALTESGYRHIDCAWIYGNEKEIGDSLKRVFPAKLKREEVFITSKLWNSFHAKANVEKGCKETLTNLGLEYLDLYLIHWGVPTPYGEKEPIGEDGRIVLDTISVRETWEAMQELVQQGLVKAIGVSNFTTPMLMDMLTYAAIPPAVNQIELHPHLQQSALLDFCSSRDIVAEAYSPLARPGAKPPREYLKTAGVGERLVDDPIIVQCAQEHGKTPAQVLIRWAVQRGTVVIPKSTTPERIKENINVFDFELTEKNMSALASLERGARLVNPMEWWKIPYFD